MDESIISPVGLEVNVPDWTPVIVGVIVPLIAWQNVGFGYVKLASSLSDITIVNEEE